MMQSVQSILPKAVVERLAALEDDDLAQLCDATEPAIREGGGFGWLRVPQRRLLERYWRGVLLVPERELYVARLNDRTVGSAQLLKPAPNNEAGAHAAGMTTSLIAPSARGHGLARGLMKAVEQSARVQGFRLLDLDVRATQTAAIQLYEEAGFKRWATKERHALVNGRYVSGHYYRKLLAEDPA
jgi:ribosomal protein S18 acetylase RimI-like enzyme